MAGYQKYRKQTQSIARRFASGDESLYGELIQEIRIAIWRLPDDADKNLCLTAAWRQAYDYTDLKQHARNVSLVSLDAIRDVGFQIDSDGNLYTPSSR